MSIFQNSFFSFAGQKERLTNVKDTLISAITGKVQSNTGIKPLDTALSSTASHPFVVAGIGAVAVSPTGAIQAAKSVASSAATAYSNASFTTQALVAGGTIVGGSAVLNSPTLAKSVVNAPSSLANFGSNVGRFVESPSTDTAKSIVKENPVVAATVGTVAAVAVGSAITGAYTTYANTKAVRENTQATLGNIQSSPEFTTVTRNLSNGHDEDIAEEQAKASIEIAKIQANYAEKQLKAETSLKEMELKLAEKQLEMPIPAIATPANPVSSVTVPIKKTKKKKTKRKSTKRKSTKRKSTKRKITKKRKVYKSKKKRKVKR